LASSLIAAPAPVSEEAKKEGELTAARRLYAITPLHGAIVTGDAINCERESATLVVENGADYVFQLKANQSGALEHAMAVAAKHPPLLPANQSMMTTVG
jgi:predicted transposase YbfD/YdcC